MQVIHSSKPRFRLGQLAAHVVVSSSSPHVPLPVPGSLGVNSGQVADDPETFDKILDGWQT